MTLSAAVAPNGAQTIAVAPAVSGPPEAHKVQDLPETQAGGEPPQGD